MTEPKIEYIGPAPDLVAGPRRKKPLWKRVPLAFLIVVVAPTLCAAFYYLLIATPRYQSESSFIIRAASQPQPSTLGTALQGVGLISTSGDAFAVHEYIMSADGMSEVQQKFDLKRLLRPRGIDVLTGWPLFWEGSSNASLTKGYKRFVSVGYDGATGISLLRVQAFDADTARALNLALLDGGEKLVNRLNDRQAADAVRDSARAVEEAQVRLNEVQQQLSVFRNREQFVDPARSAAEGTQLIGSLLATLANLRAERSQLAVEAPQSPQIRSLDNRIDAYQRQVDTERAKIAGGSTSLASKIGSYEDLVARRELAEKGLAQAMVGLIGAQQEARRQKLYLERIVAPSHPDVPTAPRRLWNILTVLASALLVYGVGWLLWAGVREHRQA